MTEPPSERAATFDRLYAANPDPWEVETSAYEQAKRDETMAALGTQCFASALEIGCSTGILTERLAPICERLVAIDVSAEALRLARERLQGQPHVTFQHGEVPRDWPAGRFHLIVFSEVLYFLSADEIVRASTLARQALADDGKCLLVNWTGPNDLPIGGDRAVDLFGGQGWRVAEHRTRPNYRIDLFA
ncbi:SAM-dependent methyltransferase [Qipengyuania sp.]|uniref:SAM-dependent methyltransferase n=1 Tax=Qipengyuania sp. TaxID=2004515 RepID=UPI003735A1B6